MAHTHDHHHDTDSDTYYLDQLCLIALSGAFAGVCLTLYYWKTNILKVMLADQFHPFVLWSGIVLLALVLIRAATLWQAAGRPANGHVHTHVHEHHHDHAHCDHGHTEGHGHTAVAEAAPPALPQTAAHADVCEHTHAHSHDCGHDHGWAPWRYVVLLLPVMLYLLGLPNKLPPVTGAASFDLTEEAQAYAAVVAAAPVPFGALPWAALAAGEHVEGTAKQVSFKALEGAAYDPAEQERLQGEVVKVVGQFAPVSGSDRAFHVVRYRIQCCGADAIRLSVPCWSREPLGALKPGDWVRVTGRVMFREVQPGHLVTILQVPRRNPALAPQLQPVVPTDPDPNPYIQ
jgi:hypothetical protein